MNDQEFFETTRYEAAERTEYRFGSRVFTLRDLSLEAYDEIMVSLEKLMRRIVEAYNNEEEERNAAQFVCLVLREGGEELAAVWNYAFQLEDDAIDGEWFRKNITVPRLKKIWAQVVKDNGWESMASAVEDKLFPFVWGLAKIKLAQVAAITPLHEQDSITS